jgi:hypothetical protein
MDQKEKHSTHSMHYGWMASRGNIGVHCAIVQLGIFGTWDPRPPDDGPLSTFPLDFYLIFSTTGQHFKTRAALTISRSLAKVMQQCKCYCPMLERRMTIFLRLGGGGGTLTDFFFSRRRRRTTANQAGCCCCCIIICLGHSKWPSI